MGSVAAEVMKGYVERWAERKGILEQLHISLCSIWIENERRPAVRILVRANDLETIMMLEDEPTPKLDEGMPHRYGTLDYYCDTGQYLRAPVKKAGLVKLYPVRINSADRATDAARRYALSPLTE